MIDDMIHIKESDPPTNITVSFTVPIVTCPLSDMSLAFSEPFEVGINAGRSSGLHIFGRSFRFMKPLGRQMTAMSAWKSYNSYSRVTAMWFYAINRRSFMDRYSANNHRSPFEGYTPAPCKVGSRFKIERKISLF